MRLNHFFPPKLCLIVTVSHTERLTKAENAHSPAKQVHHVATSKLQHYYPRNFNHPLFSNWASRMTLRQGYWEPIGEQNWGSCSLKQRDNLRPPSKVVLSSDPVENGPWGGGAFVLMLCSYWAVRESHWIVQKRTIILYSQGNNSTGELNIGLCYESLWRRCSLGKNIYQLPLFGPLT